MIKPIDAIDAIKNRIKRLPRVYIRSAHSQGEVPIYVPNKKAEEGRIVDEYV